MSAKVTKKRRVVANSSANDNASGAAADAFDEAKVTQEYYGKALQSTEDLKTDACATSAPIPKIVKDALAKIHADVHARYYGCGLVFPQDDLTGMHVLDLGCGAGRDVYVLSQLVGKGGRVIGVDFTDEMLQVATKHEDFHAHVFGFPSPNTTFVKADIQDLPRDQIPDASVDIVVSNCVVNLCKDKTAVLRQVYRVLKEGGELYFSDVYSDRRMPKALATDPVLYGECLGGALYWNDFLSLAKRAGFTDPRLVESRELLLDSKSQAIRDRCGGIRFFSATYRLFKLPHLEPSCEDFGQVVRYKGTIAICPHAFVLDDHHEFPRHKYMPVCSNTFHMLQRTRLKPHFDFLGDESVHFGIYTDCGTGLPFKQAGTDATGAQDCAGGACC